MEQLFKALPRDLQWEILSEFVGTHVVRNGKLLRKITYKIEVQSIDKSKGIIPLEMWLKGRRLHQMYKGSILCTLGDLRVLTLLPLNKWDHVVHYCETRAGETLYMYNTPTNCFEIPLDDSVHLSPFIKNVYPSYPHTDKKKRIIRNIYTSYDL